MGNNNKKKSVVVALAILLVASVSFTFAYFTAQLSGDNATNVQVSSKAQTSLIFNKGDDLSLDLGVDNLYDGAGNVTSTTNPSVSLSAPEEVTENYVISFNINANTFVYTTVEKTPELILTILDENDTPVTSVGGLSYVTQGDVSGFDITEASGLFEVITDAEITADNNTVTSDWTFTLSFINLDTDQVLNAGKDFDAEIIMDGEGITTNFAERILYFNGGVDTIESKEVDFNKATLSVEQYDTYDDWCTSADYCSIDRVTKDENGMYAIDDNGYASYYFRGSVNNNWVIFGQEGGKDIYWRIVRIEGNGNIKLIYSGTTAPTEVTSFIMTGVGTQLSSTTGFQDETIILNDAALLYQSMEGAGYVYTDNEQHGTSIDSLIKKVVDTWYTNTLESSYGDFIVPHKTCIDRVTYTRSGLGWSYEYTKNVLQEVTTSTVFYGANSRIGWQNGTNEPSLECVVSDDVLTLDAGLIGTDEVALAGGRSSTYSSSFYLYTNSAYWTMAPSSFFSSYASVFYVSLTGTLANVNVTSATGVRPVISLSSNIEVDSGNGTWNNPYVIA